MLSNVSTIDLSFLKNSWKHKVDTSKNQFFTDVVASDQASPNLLELYNYAQISYQNYLREIEKYSKSGGLKNIAAFPDALQNEQVFRFLEAFQFSFEKTLTNALINVKHDPNSQLALVTYQGKLAVAYKNAKGGLDKGKNPIYVDFLEGSSGYRINNDVNHEAVVRAVVTKNKRPQEQIILDATGGFGQDAMLIASTGARVLILERNPIIGLLLADGLLRLKDKHPNALANVAMRFPVSIFDQQFRRLVQHHELAFDSIYLDPMYPHKKSSALVNKNMQLIQAVVGQDEDADDLLTVAKEYQVARIVVKRPKNAPYLAGIETKDNIATKSHRFDLYTQKLNRQPDFARFKQCFFQLPKSHNLDIKYLREISKVEFNQLLHLKILCFNHNKSIFALENGRKLSQAYVTYNHLLDQEVVTFLEQPPHDFIETLRRVQTNNDVILENYVTPQDDFYKYLSYSHHAQLGDLYAEKLVKLATDFEGYFTGSLTFQEAVTVLTQQSSKEISANKATKSKTKDKVASPASKTKETAEQPSKVSKRKTKKEAATDESLLTSENLATTVTTTAKTKKTSAKSKAIAPVDVENEGTNVEVETIGASQHKAPKSKKTTTKSTTTATAQDEVTVVVDVTDDEAEVAKIATQATKTKKTTTKSKAKANDAVAGTIETTDVATTEASEKTTKAKKTTTKPKAKANDAVAGTIETTNLATTEASEKATKAKKTTTKSKAKANDAVAGAIETTDVATTEAPEKATKAKKTTTKSKAKATDEKTAQADLTNVDVAQTQAPKQATNTKKTSSKSKAKAE